MQNRFKRAALITLAVSCIGSYLTPTTWAGEYINVNSGVVFNDNVFSNPDDQPIKPTEKKKKEKQAKSYSTIINADNVVFDDKTGNVRAIGSVKVEHGDETLLTDKLDGNYKTGDAWIHDGGTYINMFTKTNLHAREGAYNYKEKTGHFTHVKGKSNVEYIKAEEVDVYPDRLQASVSTITRCSAENPDYYMKAEKVEIFPGDKLIAYKMKAYIKGKLIYSQDRYVTDISPNRPDSLFPMLSYSSKNGLGIQKLISRPLDDNLSVYLDFDYYTKHGFRPSAGFLYKDSNWRVDLSYGYMRDADDNWIRKQPELKVKFLDRKIGDTIFNYYFQAVYGNWKDDTKSSWHTDLGGFIYSDPIYVFRGKSWWLNMGASYQKIMESYDSSSMNVFRYNVGITKKFNNRLSAYGGYYYASQQEKLFNFDNDYLHKEMRTGLQWQVTKRDRFRIMHRYDLVTHKTYDLEYSLVHNMHCVELELKYNKKDRRTSLGISLLGF